MALVDLSRWDFTVEFQLEEAAALILGIDPAEIHVTTKPAKDNDQTYDLLKHPKIKPTADRMKRDYLEGCDLFDSRIKGEWTFFETPLSPERILRSREMEVFASKIDSPSVGLDKSLQAKLVDWWKDGGEYSIYETRKFTRVELVRWLSANNLNSIYRFDLKQPEVTIEIDIDPADLPDELSAANIAFRAVTNGYGDPLATFKNRLIGYLEKNCSRLGNEAVQRIATVANPDKTTGRKKSNAE